MNPASGTFIIFFGLYINASLHLSTDNFILSIINTNQRMKKLTMLLLAVTLTIISTAQKNFEVVTKNPTAGSVINFEYMPRNTVLQGAKDFEATAWKSLVR